MFEGSKGWRPMKERAEGPGSFGGGGCGKGNRRRFTQEYKKLVLEADGCTVLHERRFVDLGLLVPARRRAVTLFRACLAANAECGSDENQRPRPAYLATELLARQPNELCTSRSTTIAVRDDLESPLRSAGRRRRDQDKRVSEAAGATVPTTTTAYAAHPSAFRQARPSRRCPPRSVDQLT